MVLTYLLVTGSMILFLPISKIDFMFVNQVFPSFQNLLSGTIVTFVLLPSKKVLICPVIWYPDLANMLPVDLILAHSQIRLQVGQTSFPQFSKPLVW